MFFALAFRPSVITGVALGAIAVHSLFYNALFEDPMFWGLLGLPMTAPARMVSALSLLASARALPSMTP